MDWDITQDIAISRKILNETLKFHQSATWNQSAVSKHKNINQNIYNWALLNERQAVIPPNSSEVILLNNSNFTHQGSQRNYDNNKILSFNTISDLLKKSFGVPDPLSSRRYPSAGALYPIMPLFYLFNHEKIENFHSNGCYLFNPIENSLHCLKKWEDQELKEVISSINPYDGLLSNFAIGYAIDIRKSITKYRKRGYRHALIEIGLMAQAFKESLKEISDFRMGELCHSGFNDNELTFNSGLNVRLAPVSLIQWFGVLKE
ncbi:hypothetical protein [Falsibacillus pallidus]|uniref:hypothetical protein n=1 Tax=Falsibacillus pallidus TaxID=493781 RepID=UPI003D96E36B